MRSIDEAKLKVGSAMEGGFKRMGALFLKVIAVPMVSVGLGCMLYGLFQIFSDGNPHHQFQAFAIGVTQVIFGSLLWILAKKLDAAAHLEGFVIDATVFARRGLTLLFIRRHGPASLASAE